MDRDVAAIFKKLIERAKPLASLGFVAGLILSGSIFANPEGGIVNDGVVTIENIPNTTIIHQDTDKAIIDWQSFNVDAKEAVHFRQPSSSAVTLNRVNLDTNKPSQIFGTITAKGQIILINQAGIFFGAGSHIQVGGIIASTSNITNENFKAGHYVFDQPTTFGGSIVNQGHIIVAEKGLTALVGNNVSNEGVIEAYLGRVALASGEVFTIDLNGNELVNFVTVDQAASKDGQHPKDQSLMKDGVSNLGVIMANGGTILLTAKSASRVLDNAINMQGVAVANTVSVHKGVIILASDDGLVKVSGKINAKGQQEGEVGGNVKILAPQVALVDQASVNVSGENGGGEILVGGNAHGDGPEPNSNFAYVDDDVTLDASALTRGDGGKIILWSNSGTMFYGELFAKGGAFSGNGGFVETSGKEYLEIGGQVDASAQVGEAGQWLLDPYNVTISTKTSKGAFDNNNPDTYTPDNNTASASAATINASLDSGTNIVITTGSSGNQAGTIKVSSPILKSSGTTTATLTLNAASGITISNTITATSGGLNINLVGDSLTLGSDISTNGGNFSSTTQNAVTLQSGGSISTGNGTVTFNANQDGLSSQGFTINSGATITTTNATSSAIAINVNTAAGGTAAAALNGNLTTGDGGTISVITNTGSNTTGGNITMSGGSLNVGSGTITLSTAQVSGRGIGTLSLPIVLTAGNVNAITGSSGIFITNNGTSEFNLGIINTTGSVTLTSLNSAGLTSSGALTIPGTFTLAAGSTQDVNFNAPNDFNNVTITSGHNINLVDQNAIVLGPSTISGALNVTSGGSISQSGILAVSGASTFTVTSPLSDILLSSYANILSGTPIFTNNGNIRDLSLRNTSASAVFPITPSSMCNLTLNFDNTGVVLPALSLSGTLNVTTNGAITQSGALNVSGVATLAAGTLNNIILNRVDNDFNTVAITSGNDVSLQDSNALILGASTVNGKLEAIAQGAITQSGSTGLTVTGATSLTSASTITLNTATNNFSALGVTAGGNVSVHDVNALVLSASNIAGTLALTTAGNITQTAPITVTGVTTFAAGATNDITLNELNNSFSSVKVTTGRNISLVNSAALILGSSTISGTLNVTAAGAISQNGVLNITGVPTFTVTVPNADILLSTQSNLFNATPVITDNGNVRDLSLRNTVASAGVPTLPSTLRNLTLTFNNSTMSLSGATLSGSFTGQASGLLTVLGHFIVNANSTMTVLNGALAIVDGGSFMTNNKNLAITASDVQLSGSGTINAGSGSLSITANTANGIIGLGRTAGDMTISGNELQNMTASTLTLSTATNGKIIIDGITAANSDGIGTLNLQGTNGKLGSLITQNHPSSFRKLTASFDDGIIVGSGASLTTSESSLTLNGDTGGVGGLTNGIILNDNLTAAGLLTLSAAQNGITVNMPVTLNANGITFNHPVNGSSSLVLNAGTGKVSFAGTVGNITPLSQLTITETGNTTLSQDINTTGNISITTIGNITLSTGTITSSQGSVLLSGLGITLDSSINANALGDSIVIVASTFINNKGIDVFNPGRGRFLVWSTNPQNDNRGSLAYDFKQYNATYGATVLGSGNGFLYSVAPIIVPALQGEVTKVYDGSTQATLTPSNYTFSGALDSDSIVLNDPVNGVYGTAEAGNNIPVSVSGIAIQSATNGNALIYGYSIVPQAQANIGVITAAPVPNPIIPSNDALISWATTRFVTGNINANSTGSPQIAITGNNPSFGPVTVGAGNLALPSLHTALGQGSEPSSTLAAADTATGSSASSNAVSKAVLAAKTRSNTLARLLLLGFKSSRHQHLLMPLYRHAQSSEPPSFVLLSANLFLSRFAWLGLLGLGTAFSARRRLQPFGLNTSLQGLPAYSFQLRSVVNDLNGWAEVIYGDPVSYSSAREKAYLSGVNFISRTYAWHMPATLSAVFDATPSAQYKKGEAAHAELIKKMVADAQKSFESDTEKTT